ncbi:Anthranilate synthase component 1 [Salmonella enterica subsp. arizonae]|uniref:Anthranilate synthase component 1 n=1 Tax=Salmonella enterica subsp. arizonae TaxID=59203 RepID=A0A2X4TAK0_SALER|nr:Anthranilate synthase component 1 [Salmonella enterica subsp. arizonae]
MDSALRIIAFGDTVTIEALSDNGASLLPLLDIALPAGVENACLLPVASCAFRPSAHY